MPLQGILDDIFGPGEQSPSNVFGDNPDRTEQRVAQLEGLEEQPIEEPGDGQPLQLNTELYIEEVVDSQPRQNLSADGLSGKFNRVDDPQKLNFSGFIPRSDDPDAGGGGGVELALGTVTPVDLDGIENVNIEWRHDSNDGEYATQDRSYFGIDNTRSDINRKNVEKTSGEPDRSILNSDTSFEKKPDTLDVSGISGTRHVGVGIQVSSNYEQSVELDVFDVWGVDSNGTRMFEFDIHGN
jgi:hypothetical protein